eukprot:COSAG01_NODE_3450_length_6083_cov_3.770555_7_plen_138_part_00
MKKQDAGMNLRSHSLDKLRQIITTGAWECCCHRPQATQSTTVQYRYSCTRMKKISVLPAEAEPRLRRRSPQASHGLFYTPRWMPRFSLEKAALAASVLTEQFGEIVQVRVRMPSEAHTVGVQSVHRAHRPARPTCCT